MIRFEAIKMGRLLGWFVVLFLITQTETLFAVEEIKDTLHVDCGLSHADSSYFAELIEKISDLSINDPSMAAERSQKVLQCLESKMNDLEEWQSRRIGYLYYYVGDFENALYWLDWTCTHLKQRISAFQLYDAMYMAGLCSWHLGQYQHASQKFQLVYFEARGIDRLLHARATYMLGHTYANYLNPVEGERLLKEAFTMYRPEDVTDIPALILFNLSHFERARGKPQKALELIVRGRALSKNSKNQRTQFLYHAMLGQLYMTLSDETKSIFHLLKALSLSRLNHDDRSEIIMTHLLGNHYLRNKSYELAARFFQQGHQAAIKLKNDELISRGLFYLGTAYYYNDQKKDALTCFLDADRYDEISYAKDQREKLADIDVKFRKQTTLLNAEIIEEQNKLSELRLIRHKQWLFAILCLLSISIPFFIIVLRRKRMEQQYKAAVLNQQLMSRQMNPHFIFNAFNSIQFLLHTKQASDSKRFLSKLGALIQMVMQNCDQHELTLSKELNAIQLYLELETLRHKEKLRYEINVDPTIVLPLVKIPPMIIQPFVENAILHGIIPKEKNGYIQIKLSHSAGNIICLITDNGIGRKKAAENRKSKSVQHNSLGMKITEQRIKLYNALQKKKLHFEIIDLYSDEGSPSGTQVKITIQDKMTKT